MSYETDMLLTLARKIADLETELYDVTNPLSPRSPVALLGIINKEFEGLKSMVKTHEEQLTTLTRSAGDASIGGKQEEFVSVREMAAVNSSKSKVDILTNLLKSTARRVSNLEAKLDSLTDPLDQKSLVVSIRNI